MTAPISSTARRPAWMRYGLLALIVATFIAFAPILSALGAGAIAQSHGCALDEGSVHPCIVFGSDIGELLYDMFVMGWMFLLTMPLAIAAGIGWIAFIVVVILRALRGNTAA